MAGNQRVAFLSSISLFLHPHAVSLDLSPAAVHEQFDTSDETGVF